MPFITMVSTTAHLFLHLKKGQKAAASVLALATYSIQCAGWIIQLACWIFCLPDMGVYSSRRICFQAWLGYHFVEGNTTFVGLISLGISVGILLASLIGVEATEFQRARLAKRHPNRYGMERLVGAGQD